MEQIKKLVEDSIRVKTEIMQDEVLIAQIWRASQSMIATLKAGGKILLCGNGGSASDAQHIAAELSGRFQKERLPYYAEALHVNGSFITAVSNDYGFDQAYARMVQAAGRQEDILIAISTSGRSKNILKAVKTAQEIGMYVISMTGGDGGTLSELADIDLCMPSSVTARIQEAHILVGHILCEIVEDALS